MTKRIQIVARIDPDLRKSAGRVVKRQKTTLNAVVTAALRGYVETVSQDAVKSSPKETR